MPLTIRCPRCNQTFDVATSSVGQSTTCRYCNAEIRIPLPKPATSGLSSNAEPIRIASSDAQTSPAPKPAGKRVVDESAIAWKVVFGLGVVMMLIRKFGCSALPQPPQGTGGAELEQFKANASKDFALGIVVVALVGWGAFELIRAIVRAANTDSKPEERRTSTAAGAVKSSSVPPPPPPPPPPPVTVRWWLHRNGQTLGPFATNVVVEMLRSGQLPRETPVCREGRSDWTPLTGCPEFETVK